MGQPSREDTPGWLDRGQIPALNGLRAIAVLLVCLSHVSVTSGFPHISWLKSVSEHGAVGVDVFFVLSGFLITTLLCRERDRLGRVSLKAFYIRRGFRILPAYIAYLLFIVALTNAGLAHTSTNDWLAAATYTMNFVPHPAWELGHIWSLSIEEHFYLAWPMLFILLSRRGASVALVGVLIVGPMVRWCMLLWRPDWIDITELWTFMRLDTIAAGCLLALTARNADGVRRLDNLAKWWIPALALLVTGLVTGVKFGKIGAGITPTITALTTAVLVWSAARSAPRWLNSRVLVIIGVGSYSLYLWQEPFLNPRSHYWWTTFPQNLVLAGLAALASHWLVERPFLRIKDRFHTTPIATTPTDSKGTTEELQRPDISAGGQGTVIEHRSSPV